MNHINRPKLHEFFYLRRKRCKRLYVVCSQAWYDPYIVAEQKINERPSDFRRRMEKRIGGKPCSYTEHRRAHMRDLRASMEFQKQYN